MWVFTLSISNIYKELRKEKVISNYEKNGRLIDIVIYKELKAKKKCMLCKKPFSGQIPSIHHKIPISKGGTNEKSNLMAVHKSCHKLLDKEALK